MTASHFSPRVGDGPTLFPPRRRAAAGSVLALTSLLAACSGTDSAPADSWAGTVTDSAGIDLVANPREGLWGRTPGWTLVEEYRVGGMDAETDAQIAQVAQIHGIELDAAGNIYVADAQAQTVRVYSADGAFLRTIGSPGRGPGEIGPGMVALFVVGEELWVADMGNLRVNRYGLDGGTLGAIPIDITRGIPFRWDELDGDRVVVQFRGVDAEGMTALADGDPIVEFGPSMGDTLAVLPRGASFEITGGAPRFRFFEAEPVWDAAADGRIVSAMNSDYRIEVRGADGTLDRIVTRAFERRPVTESDQAAMRVAIRQLMTDQGAPPQAVDLIMGQATFAEYYPAFAQLLAGPDGSLWVQRIATAKELGEAEEFDLQNLGSDDWDVFDADGRYLGMITMPHRFTPVRVEGEAFWGVQRDEFDVQSVVRYSLGERAG